MTPKKLSLKNFLSHENTVIDFSNMDAICLYGRNGSGKTAIIDAMLFALYGQTSRGSDDSLIQQGKDKMEVEFIFELNGNEYKIEKTKEKGQTKQSILYRNGEVVATGSKTDDYIIELFGMNYNTFTSTYFLLQDNAYKFILATPSERYKVLFDILNLNIYQEYKKIVSQYRKDTENKIKFYQQNVEEKQNKINEMKHIDDEADFYTTLFHDVQNQIKQVEEQYIQYEKMLTDYVNKKQEYEKQKQQIEDVNSQIITLLNNVKKYQEILKHKNQVENALQRKQALENEYNKLFQKEKEIIDQLEQEKMKLSDLLKQEQFYTKEIGNLERNISSFESEIESYDKYIEDYKKLINLLDRIPCKGVDEFSKCELIQNALQAKQKLPEINEKKQTRQKQLEGLVRHRDNFEKDLLKITKEKEKLSEIYYNITNNLKMIQSQKEKLMKEISSINKIIDYMPQIIQAEQTLVNEKERLSQLEEMRQSIKQQIEQMEQYIQKYRDIEEKTNILKQELQDLKQREKQIQDNLITIKTKLLQKEQLQTEIDNINQEIEREKTNLTVYTLLEDAYDKIPKIMLNNYMSIIESTTNDILEKISPSSMQVELVTEKTTKTTKVTKNTIDIHVSDIMGERKIENFSGGEKTRLTLAFTVALSELASHNTTNKLKTLVIDEPPGLDEQGFKDFALCIKQLINTGIFNKCLVVSHSGELIEEFEHKIKFEKLKTGISKCYIETMADDTYKLLNNLNLFKPVPTKANIKTKKLSTSTSTLF